MSRLYDTVEPSVIDSEMLLKAIEEQGPKEEAGKIAKNEGIDYCDVLALRLDFRNILKVDNLWQLTKLTKLQLDNNIIEKIEGLDCLTNLKWLDLSFNNIEVIDGLSKLTLLEDLTLFNNRISFLENMDSLTNLHVFSIGNNKLDKLDNLIYMRRFNRLRTLNLTGNPVCDDPGYKLFTVAYLSQLVYLDFRLIDQDCRLKANQLYENKLGELMHNEKQAVLKQERIDAAAKEFQMHKDAYVDNLNGSYLFETLYKEDPEGNKLKDLPVINEMVKDFEKKFTEISVKIFDYGIKEHERRTNDVSLFNDCIRDAKVNNTAAATKLIDQFNIYKKQVFADLLSCSDPEEQDEKIKSYHTEVAKLWDSTMTLEMQLVDQLEETIKDFERNITEMVSQFVEYVQGLITQLRDLENTHHEKMLETCMVILEKVVKNELEEELTDDLRMLFVDKDTISNALGASHDVHLLNIDNREDDIVTRSSGWILNMMTDINRCETERNRRRVAEIFNFIDHLKDDVDNLELPESAQA